MSHVAPAAHVRHAEVAGSVVVLDLRSGTYLALDDVASAMWSSFAVDGTGSDEHLIREIVARFEVEPERVRSDLTTFRERCLADGLLDDAGDERRSAHALPAWRAPAARIPALAAWRCLVDTARMLQQRGFSETYRTCAAIAPAFRAPSAAALARAARAFSLAENFVVSRRAPSDCLPRSLALFRFLRAMELPAEHVIGVKRFPFAAHAWVECGGRVVLDRDRRDELTALARIA